MKSASLQKPFVPIEEQAGRYASYQGHGRRMAFEPAANEIGSRDFNAEASDARALVETYVEVNAKRVQNDTVALTSRDLLEHVRDNISQRLRAPAINVRLDPAQNYFISTQEWDGYVVSISDEEFDAVIYPVGADGDFRQDTVTVPKWLVNEDASHLLRPGAIFRLATGKQRRKRQNSHSAKLYFRQAVDAKRPEGLTLSALEAFLGD